MKITITPAAGRNPVYRTYQGQYGPQDAYIELDCRDGKVRADYSGEIGNMIPFSVYHGHVRRFGIPAFATCKWINRIMRECRPQFQSIVDGYESEWDGHNNVARFTDAANDEIEALANYISRQSELVPCPAKLDVY